MDSVLLTVSSSLVQSSLLAFSASKRPSKENLFRYSRCRWSPCSVPLRCPKRVFGFRNGKHLSGPDKPLRLSCFNGAKKEPQSSSTKEESGLDWPILQRWDVPWKWQTVTLTIFGCGISIVTVVVLGVIFGITNSFKPYPDDIFRYKFKDPFNLRNGWLLWAGIGFVGAILAIALTGAALALFNSENPQRETDALVRLSPLIGSSTISTACLVGITGVLAPVLEETLFRGFLMVSLTKWFPTPVSALLAAAVFAVAHLTPGEFPQLFVLGAVLGFSYAQTRNLLTPITIHALWNSGVILLLTFLQLQGYDIRELLQGQ